MVFINNIFMIIIKFYYKVYDNWESYICVLYIFVYDGYIFFIFCRSDNEL